ncbi:cbb3-type cytochrome oxidase assembly protein CcoS [Bosea sp. ASV33]|uniref:cbb3-type cytochrome oxidase assembly protein CcoS n=1 Tax=Bosea sp. ASV33 TaxID=2795106 RepID=UPI0018EB79EB|nr:cbb3-type cytochrome oxidase assembly protein CcoS [Bosea sp. ASV33]
MNIIVILFPLALGLGLLGLGAFFWCMRSGQFADLEGAAWRVLQDDDAAASPVEKQPR